MPKLKKRGLAVLAVMLLLLSSNTIAVSTDTLKAESSSFLQNIKFLIEDARIFLSINKADKAISFAEIRINDMKEQGVTPELENDYIIKVQKAYNALTQSMADEYIARLEKHQAYLTELNADNALKANQQYISKIKILGSERSVAIVEALIEEDI